MRDDAHGERDATALSRERALLTNWHATVTATVEEILDTPTACTPETKRAAVVDAQMAIADCGRRLLDVLARLQGKEAA